MHLSDAYAGRPIVWLASVCSRSTLSQNIYSILSLKLYILPIPEAINAYITIPYPDQNPPLYFDFLVSASFPESWPSKFLTLLLVSLIVACLLYTLATRIATFKLPLLPKPPQYPDGVTKKR